MHERTEEEIEEIVEKVEDKIEKAGGADIMREFMKVILGENFGICGDVLYDFSNDPINVRTLYSFLWDFLHDWIYEEAEEGYINKKTTIKECIDIVKNCAYSLADAFEPFMGSDLSKKLGKKIVKAEVCGKANGEMIYDLVCYAYDEEGNEYTYLPDLSFQHTMYY